MKHIESVARTSEGGTEIFGVAAVSMFSRNDNVYFPAELARNHGKTVPLNWMHEDPVRKIGEVTLTFNEEKRRLMYKGVITDPKVADLVKNRELFVSIGADSQQQQEVCDTAQCYNAPIGLEIFELSIVDVPGIPEVSLNVLNEHFKESFTSVTQPATKTRMVEAQTPKPQDKEVSTKTEDITIKQTDSQPEKSEEPQKTEIDCPPGQQADPQNPTQCVKAEDKQESGCGCGKSHGEEPVANAPNVDTRTTQPEESKTSQVQVDTSALENALKSKFDDLSKEIADLKGKQEKSEQIARVSTENGQFTANDMRYLANEWVKNINRIGKFNWEVDLTPKEVHERLGYSNPFDYKRKDFRVQEALSFTQGDVSNEIGDTSIISLPGGKYRKSIRDLVHFQEIPKGADTFTLFLGDQPDEQTITEGRTTATAEGAQDTFTITPVDMTANTTTGYYTSITKSQMQKSPIGFMKYINEMAKFEAAHREAVSAFKTTIDAITTPTNWIDATDGTVVANQTAEDAVSGTFDPKGISKAAELLGDAGYIEKPGDAYAIITWKQYRELIDDADLDRWVQQGKASITETGQLGRLHGIDIIPVPKSVIQETASNTLRAVVGTRKRSIWLASGRSMNIKSAEEIGKLTVDVAMDKQINSGVIDGSSLAVICSSA